ncbi:MAG: hypothetical protein PHV63_01765 [Candidatus Daviesbacteria bacterium]|nr:hypothetical protein [Candidatus Daviesbacteria bacterium]
MARILINLLPPEVMAQELKKAKFYKIQFAGIIIVLIMVFLASLTLALRILQNQSIAVIQATLAQEEQKVSDLKGTQASLFLLKNRLNGIDQYFGKSSQQSSMYKLIDKLIPVSVLVNAITIDKTGGAVVLATVPDSASLDNLVNNLTNKEVNESKISQVSVETLNRGRDGFYRIGFKIK